MKTNARMKSIRSNKIRLNKYQKLSYLIKDFNINPANQLFVVCLIHVTFKTSGPNKLHSVSRIRAPDLFIEPIK